MDMPRNRFKQHGEKCQPRPAAEDDNGLVECGLPCFPFVGDERPGRGIERRKGGAERKRFPRRLRVGVGLPDNCGHRLGAGSGFESGDSAGKHALFLFGKAHRICSAE